jgi:predicted Fe-Mo cluster-binding NifX family protein
MKIAVASQDFDTVSPHAGKTGRFLLFDAVPGGAPLLTGKLDLPDEMTMHAFTGGKHPLDSVDVLIAASAGPGFIAKMQERGVKVVTTSESDAQKAVEALMKGKLAAADCDDDCSCDCEHHHH